MSVHVDSVVKRMSRMKVAKSGEPDQRHSISRFILHHNETRDAVR